MALKPLPVHVVVPDTQVKPGVPTDHMTWIGTYIRDQFAGREDVTIIHLGDHWDMPSLSSYDKGKKAMEGRRYADDIAAGNDAFYLLNKPLAQYNAGRRRRGQAEWAPRKVFLHGNHEARISRAAEENAQLEGTVSLDDLNTQDWEVHQFLHPVNINGVAYAHYWQNPMNGRPISGMIETRIKTIGRSFTQGHQQVLMYGLRPSWTMDGQPTMHHGLVAGSCYLHDEKYLGPQGNAYWRGIIVCHEVRNGAYDPMFVSLDYLCRRYEGVTLDEFMPGIGLGRAA